MAKRTLEIKSHLALDDLRNLALTATQVRQRRRWLLVFLASAHRDLQSAAGLGVAELARMTGFTPQHVRHLLRAYNAKGPSALERKRQVRRKLGRRRALNSRKLQKLKRLLREDPYMSSKEVRDWAVMALGCEMSITTAWRYLDKVRKEVDQEGGSRAIPLLSMRARHGHRKRRRA